MDRASLTERKKMRILNKIPEDLLLKDPPQTGDLEGGGGARGYHLGKYLELLTSLENVA